MKVREYNETDLADMRIIWNAIVEKGDAFPEEDALTLEAAKDFFGKQSFTGVAEIEGEVVGLYVVHPNNVGRCGHIANASYLVKPGQRGRGIGEKLVLHSLDMAGSLGFRIMQFNAVLATNETAIRLYKKLGFTALGTIPKGFRQLDGTYVDIIPFYYVIGGGGR